MDLAFALVAMLDGRLDCRVNRGQFVFVFIYKGKVSRLSTENTGGSI
jgi:hypothetical protein